MKTRINNISAIIFIIGLISFIIYVNCSNKQKDSEIKQQGFYTYGVIVDLIASTGSTRRVDFSYLKNKKSNYYVTRKFYREIKIGDTIIIQFLLTNPTKSLIIENVKFKKCMFNKGRFWKYLPKC